jgi:post-segregation antitoxin (ccd killing protein)
MVAPVKSFPEMVQVRAPLGTKARLVAKAKAMGLEVSELQRLAIEMVLK